MPALTLMVDGRRWEVYPSGRVTQYDRDEFALVFVARTGADREVRVTRYSPVGNRSREQSLASLSERDLRQLFDTSQPADTSPEANYSA